MKFLVILAGFCSPLIAQQPSAFDVAVIKPADLTNPGRGIGIGRGNRTLTISGLIAGAVAGGAVVRRPSETTAELIQRTYAIQESQLSGGPPWTNSERFDISAKVESETPPSVDQLWRMLEQLLADRFALKFHRETRTLPGYALDVGKTGAKLGESTGAAPNLSVSRGQLQATKVSMSMLTNMLSRYLGRPIFDETGLKGSYDFRMTWTPTDTEQSLPTDDKAVPVDASGSSIFTALQDQLGLKLESKKVPVEIFVVDRVEKPSEN